jgi:peptidyl-prolyl cis-trans isomerase SurA
MTRRIILATVALAAAAPVAAQETGPRTDRIGHVVAIVGDSAILNFDVQEAVIARAVAARQQPPEPGPEYDRIARQVLDDLINEMLVVQEAIRDTMLVVQEDQINRAVERQIEQDQQTLGGAAALERELRNSGQTLEAYRRRLSAQYRKRQLIQLYQQKLVRDRRAPPVTDQELRDAFEAQRARLPMREPTLTFQQVLVRTQPSEAALAAARQQADSVFALVRAGEDFADLARRFSDDGTRENGGDLGFIRRSDVVREFGNVAFALRPGEVSPPIRTPFGYHLIKVERIRGAEVQVRHILFRPELSDADALRARARADTVVQRLREGADIAELARQYGDTDTPLRGGPAPIDTLQRVFQTDLASVQPGELLGPIPLGGDDVASEFFVIRVTEREAAREWRLDDPQMSWLREQVAQQKLLDEVLTELRRANYVEIRQT